MKRIILFCFLANLAFAQTPKPYGATPTADQVKWHNMEYYAFIHFGPNAFTDKEWGDGTEKEEIFNPTQLDCRQWARICKAAGMKGIIITAKHHDGFALYPSKYSKHTVRESKWKDGKGDVLKELSAACKEYGLKMGIYISPWDRNHPAYGTPEYNQVYVNMLKEVTTQYGDLFEVWFDGANGEGPNGKKQVYDFPLFNKTVKTYQPHALIFSDAGPDIRWVGNENGFAGETCWATINGNQLFPAYDKPAHLNVGDENGTHWIPAECDVSIRPGWFYHKNEDNKVKSDKDLMNIWNKSVGRGSNLLLNIPVDYRGLIHENDEKALMDFKKLRNEYFKKNLLTAGTFTMRLSQDSYDITLTKPQTFNCVVIQEDIKYGQRVKKFSVQVKEDGSWKNIATATTISHKRIVYFEKTTSKELRIVFEEALAKPIISKVELFNVPD
ncbi:alpha-L-fucosidase [Emticicia sp. SJ17W-69]|uniref:alpha-L-fucosidase n=1 Tax=Emticicia sp. SJ17W-69 TaxID=3421657 RepID=UPI003EBA6907